MSGENWQQKIDKSQERIDEYLKKKAFEELDISDIKARLKELSREYHKKDTNDLIDEKTVKSLQNKLVEIDDKLKELTRLQEEAVLSILEKENKIKKISDFIDSVDINEIRQKRDAKKQN